MSITPERQHATAVISDKQATSAVGEAQDWTGSHRQTEEPRLNPGEETPKALWLAPAAIVIYWLLNFLIVSPAGNFPLNDDWIYSESVAYLLKTGQFHLLGCSPACFLHVVLGALACLPFGFSHEILRGLTAACGLVTSVVFYATLVSLGIKRADSALITLVMAVNPLFVNLSFSFMTDVPAAMFTSLYVLFAIASVQKQSSWRAAVAGLWLCCAILIRQSLAVLAPASLLLLLCKNRSRKMQAVVLVAAVVAPIVVALFAERLMIRGNEFLGVYAFYKNQFVVVASHLITSPVSGFSALSERLFKIFCYVGFFCLPIMPALIAAMVREIRRRQIVPIVSLVSGALIAIPCFVHVVCLDHQLMPFNPNLLRIPMVGPINLMGICVAALKTRQRLWLTIVCGVLAWLLLSFVVGLIVKAALNLKEIVEERLKRLEPVASLANGRSVSLFACAFLVLTLGFLSIQTSVFDFDRYYLTALPPLLVCFGLYARQTGMKLLTPLSATLVVLFGCYSTLASLDYLGWNRARYQATSELEHAGVSPLRIDGGPEYNYLADPSLMKECEFKNGSYGITHRGVYPRCNWRWWPINGEDYIISFSPVPDYDIVARHQFFGGLTLSQRDVLTLKRAQEVAPSKR
jgi:hypothetical protein